MRKDTLVYKDFFASVHFSPDDGVFFGKIEGIDDLVTFEGESVQDLREAFESAVDDYLDICTRNGKDPKKSYRGSFNVRITPELHRRLARVAVETGVSLNQLVQNAIEGEVCEKEAEYGVGPGEGTAEA